MNMSEGQSGFLIKPCDYPGILFLVTLRLVRVRDYYTNRRYTLRGLAMQETRKVIMSKLYKSLILICLMLATNAAVADVGQDIKNGMNIESALNAAVSAGMTIDQAVAGAITLNPELAEAIVTAAFTILNNLPDGACAVLDESGKQVTPLKVDREDCGRRIIQEALAANENLDPLSITEAAAAGRTGGPGGPGVPPGAGDGNRGGNISPS